MIVDRNFTEPENRKSIAHGIRREDVRDRYFEMGDHVVLPCKCGSRWSTLVGSVIQINRFDDGVLLTLDQEHNSGSILENWEEVPLWIPTRGQCGVLVPSDHYE